MRSRSDPIAALARAERETQRTRDLLAWGLLEQALLAVRDAQRAATRAAALIRFREMERTNGSYDA